MNSQILITGAPGNVGTEVVKALSGKAALRIGAYRVADARSNFPEVPDIVRFDFLDPTTFDTAFAGIDKLFLVRPPALSNVKRDIVPALIAAHEAGVRYIVFLSIQGVEQNRMVPHYRIEQAIRELGFTYTFLRASFFMQNLNSALRDEIRDNNAISVPVGRAKTSFIDTRDIAAVAAHVLTEAGHENACYTLTGSEALDYDEVAKTLTVTLNRPVRYANPSVVHFVRKELAAGRKLDFALVTAGLYTITRFGNASEVTTDVEHLLGHRPISLQQYVQDYRATWMAA